MTSFIEDLKADMDKYRLMLPRFECLKLDVYIANLFDRKLNEEEDTFLEMDVSAKVHVDACMSYMLAKLNYLIVSSSQFDIQVRDKSVVSLKDKFLNILQAMDTEEVRRESIGLLLYVASRLYYLLDGKRIYLISCLKSSLFSETETWDHYFIQRVNRGSSQNSKSPMNNIQKTIGFLKTPLDLIGITKSQKDPKAVQLKEAMSRKDFHPAVLMEIAQHLVMLNVGPDDSTNILLELFKKYKIESNLMQSVFIVHQKAISSQFESKIKQSLTRRLEHEAYRNAKVFRAVKLSISYLQFDDLLEFSLASKSTRKQAFDLSLEFALKYCSMNNSRRSRILHKYCTDKCEKAQAMENIKKPHDCVLTSDQTKLLEFDIKRTSQIPYICNVARPYLAAEIGPEQYCVALL